MAEPASGQSVQRYYDPAIGRFLSVDPVGPLSNPINHFGRYHYANNNPYKYTDPDGRLPILIPIAIVAWRAYSAYDTVSTAAGNISTVADSAASTGDRVAAGAELAGSLIGGRVGRQVAGGVVKAADAAKDTVNATRRQALNSAKDANGVPRSAQPDAVIKPGTPAGDAAGLDSRNVRQYEYTNSQGEKVSIREDRAATYSDGGSQPPHFNAGRSGEKLDQHHYIDDKKR